MIFRIGGDEFLVMSSRVAKEDMEKQIQKLREDMPNFGVNLALGWVWEPQCNGRITELLKEADKKMYEEKGLYYEEHPDSPLRRK